MTHYGFTYEKVQVATTLRVFSQPLVALPEDALGLVPVECKDLLREAGLHPGQLPVRVSLLLHGDDVLQGAAEHGRVEDGVLGMADLLDVRLLQALEETSHRRCQNLLLVSSGP